MNSLFSPFPILNLLPYHGIVEYYGIIFTDDSSKRHFENLMKVIDWQNDKAVIYGKEIITKRKVAWYGDEPYSYIYSGTEKFAQPWNNELLELKTKVEFITREKYNSCLLNLYHNGMEGMAYHSDDEKDLEAGASIASLSFGVGRKFSFKHKIDKRKVDIFLEPGSLLEMKGETQKNWHHRLPPTTTVSEPRINLTFRKMKET